MTVTLQGLDAPAEYAQALLTALRACLTATAAGVPPKVCLVPGVEVAYDEEMAWVRVVNQWPSTEQSLITEDQEVRRTPGRWTVALELGVMRCTSIVQVADNRPLIPSPEALTADTLRTMADARAVRNAAIHVAAPPTLRTNMLIRPWIPLGPQAGLAGGAMTVLVPFKDAAPLIT